MDSTSMATPEIKYDVFLSFRGRDTRKNFIGFLCSALTRHGIDVFVDNRLDLGEEISNTLLNKIPECRISVVVISKSYGESPWCLDELVKIVECKEKMGQIMIPVCFRMHTSDVKNLTGKFGEGFRRLTQNPQFKDKEEIWRDAMLKTIEHVVTVSEHKSEDVAVDEVISRIVNIVNQVLPEDSGDGFVGIERVEKVISLLDIGSLERLRFVGIWGMGGIGKTTIATKVYDRLLKSKQFDATCLILRIGDRTKGEGLECLCKDMLAQLLKNENLQVTLEFSSPIVRNILQKKKVLIILDDVTDLQQLKALVKPPEYYSPGSRTILTGRDKQLLKSRCKDILYEVGMLNDTEAFQLFKYHAIKDQPFTKRHKEISEKVARYAKGLPLALEVLGCNLYDKNIQDWENQLVALEEKGDETITKILRVSYDGLTERLKSTFLDIACCFHDQDKDLVQSILDSSEGAGDTQGSTAGWAISCLLDKALITISDGTLRMHDLVQQMGRDIVSDKCIRDPSKRSRLWKFKDIHSVLTGNLESAKVEIITLEMPRLSSMELKPKAFKRMTELRVLDFHIQQNIGDILLPRIDDVSMCLPGIFIPKGLDYLPNKLRYLSWDSFPLKYLPSKFSPDNLVTLHLRHSSIVQLWNARIEPYLPHLKYMDLSFSIRLIELPDFSRIPNLETLELSGCKNLIEVPPSIQHLTKLTHLTLDGCWSLVRLPSSIHYLSELTVLSLSECTSLVEVPSGINCLRKLYLRNCRSLTCLPELPPRLQVLDALKCISLRTIRSFFREDRTDFEFRFANCFNLDFKSKNTILNDTMLAIDRVVSFDHLYQGFAENQYPVLEPLYTDERIDGCSEYWEVRGPHICIPGSEVPEFFTYKRAGSQLVVKLSCGRILDLRQLVLCAVVGIYNGSTNFRIMCKCSLVTECRRHTVRLCYNSDLDNGNLLDHYNDDADHMEDVDHMEDHNGDFSIGGDHAHPRTKHIFIWHDRKVNSPCFFAEATFEFSIVDWNNFPVNGYRVMRCGVTSMQGNHMIPVKAGTGDIPDISPGGRASSLQGEIIGEGRPGVKALFSRRAQASQQQQRQQLVPSEQQRERDKEPVQYSQQKRIRVHDVMNDESDDNNSNDQLIISKKAKQLALSSDSNPLYIPDWNVQLNDTIFDHRVAFDMGKALLLRNDRLKFSVNTSTESHQQLVVNLAQGLAAAVHCWGESNGMSDQRKTPRHQAEEQQKRREDFEKEIIELKQQLNEASVEMNEKDKRIHELGEKIKGLREAVEDLERAKDREMLKAQEKVAAERARAEKAELDLTNQVKKYDITATSYAVEGFNECRRLVKWLWHDRDVEELHPNLVANVPDDFINIPPYPLAEAATTEATPADLPDSQPPY